MIFVESRHDAIVLHSVKIYRAKIRIIYDFRITIEEFILPAAFQCLRRFYAFGVSVASPFQWLRGFNGCAVYVETQNFAPVQTAVANRNLYPRFFFTIVAKNSAKSLISPSTLAFSNAVI